MWTLIILTCFPVGEGSAACAADWSRYFFETETACRVASGQQKIITRREAIEHDFGPYLDRMVCINILEENIS